MTEVTSGPELTPASTPYMTRPTRAMTLTWERVSQIKVRVSEGPDRGKEMLLEGDSTRRVQGGRSRINEIVLADEHVSGSHFELTLLPTGVLLRDLESTNGIHVAGARVKEAWIGPGSVFTVGQTVIELLAANSTEVVVSSRTRFGRVTGESMVMRELFATLERSARLELPMLITGESGTGKDLVGRSVHEYSQRSRGRFVAVNCTCAPLHLLESQLFGHARGAFPGAKEDRAGCFEEAIGGTVFLDAIGELPLEIQAKLVRAIQGGEVVRLGEQAPRKVHARVLAATHRDLRRLVSEGKFREDLYRALAGLRVIVPSLVERADDIIPLAERFLQRLIDNRGVIRSLSANALDALRSHRWPGNVRELRSVIERAYYMSEQEWITSEELGLDPWGALEEMVAISARAFERTLKDAREEVERIYLRRLMASDGTQASKARRAGLTDEGLRQALKRLGLRE